MPDPMFAVDVATATSRPPGPHRWRRFRIAAPSGLDAALIACQWAWVAAPPDPFGTGEIPVMAVESYVVDWEMDGHV